MSAHKPLTVLVVDDHSDAANTLADLLRLHGHRVAVAHSAREAVGAAAADPPDVALLDIRLPDMNGWQVARWLREQSRTCGRAERLFLVAVTGSGEDADRWRSVDSGIDLHLVKPVDPTLLVGVLARFGRGLERPASGAVADLPGENAAV